MSSEASRRAEIEEDAGSDETDEEEEPLDELDDGDETDEEARDRIIRGWNAALERLCNRAQQQTNDRTCKRRRDGAM